MSDFRLRIIASNGIMYEGRGKKLIFTTTDGLFEILPHHENMIIAVGIGEGRFQKTDDEWEEFISGQGFVEVLNNRVTMIVNSAEHPDEIDKVRAQEALERAQEKMLHKQSRQEYVQTQASLARAMSRLKAGQHKKIHI